MAGLQMRHMMLRLRHLSDGIETRPTRSKNASRPRLQPWLMGLDFPGFQKISSSREKINMGEFREITHNSLQPWS